MPPRKAYRLPFGMTRIPFTMLQSIAVMSLIFSSLIQAFPVYATHNEPTPMQGIRLFGTVLEPNVHHQNAPRVERPQPLTPQPMNPQPVKFWGKDWDDVLQPVASSVQPANLEVSRDDDEIQDMIVEETATEKKTKEAGVKIFGQNLNVQAEKFSGGVDGTKSAFQPFKQKPALEKPAPEVVPSSVFTRPANFLGASTGRLTATSIDMTRHDKKKQAAIDMLPPPPRLPASIVTSATTIPSTNLPPRPRKEGKDKGKGKQPVVDLTPPSSPERVTAPTITVPSAATMTRPVPILPKMTAPELHQASKEHHLSPIVIDVPLSKNDFRVIDAWSGKEEEYDEAKHGRYHVHSHPDNFHRYSNHADLSIEQGTMTPETREFGLRNIRKSIYAINSMLREKGAIFHENRGKIFFHPHGTPEQALKDFRAFKLRKLKVNKDGRVSIKKSYQDKLKNRLVSESSLNLLRASKPQQALEVERHNQALAQKKGNLTTTSDESSSDEEI